MRYCLAAPATKFLKIYLSFNRFLVFVGIIILPFADGALQRD